MDDLSPQSRQCSLCEQSYTLNLFRQSLSVCRYCELELKPPQMLKEGNLFATKTKEETTYIENGNKRDAVLENADEEEGGDIFYKDNNLSSYNDLGLDN